MWERLPPHSDVDLYFQFGPSVSPNVRISKHANCTLPPVPSNLFCVSFVHACIKRVISKGSYTVCFAFYVLRGGSGSQGYASRVLTSYCSATDAPQPQPSFCLTALGRVSTVRVLIWPRSSEPSPSVHQGNIESKCCSSSQLMPLSVCSSSPYDCYTSSI